ncbi:MAG: efflux RND transporter periplasmic adaptor subunit, partial [Bryobacteraceae bacterium]
RQLAAQSAAHAAPGGMKPPHPSRSALWLLCLLLVAAFTVAFLAGYLPRQRREATILAESESQERALPVVSVASVVPAPPTSRLLLPGNIQAVTEAPVLARADGYIKKRYADIGDRVKEGQLLAEIAAPELDQQVRQAKATLQQAQASHDQASANYQQGKANAELAGVTAKRWQNLASQGAVSRQENDQYQSQYRAQTANLEALQKAIAAARSNVGAAEANLARLQDLQAFTMVRAPFRGVITLRNIDVGALIAAGNTLLFRIAQTNMLRTYVNVPQANAGAIHGGQMAEVSVADLPGRPFAGKVRRTADSLDPSSRTLLAEVQVPNPDGALMPGMYATVDLNVTRKNPPLTIPGDALVVRADGTQVALVRLDSTVHFQRIQVGRDYGDRLEVTGGLKAGDRVIVNPGDTAREGAKVKAVEEKPDSAGTGKRS